MAAGVLIGCGGDDEQTSGGPGGGGPGGGGERPPMPVEIATVTAAGMADEFTVVGDLDADYEITVAAEIAARVTALPFAEGARLREGDLIARLDDAQLQAEMQRAEALVQQRRATFERVRTVVAERAGAPQDLDDAAAALAVAEADLALVRARLAKTRITAPFGGVVGARQVSPGAYLRPGETITQLARIDSLRVTFTAPELHLGRLGVGSPVRVRTSAFPDLVVDGTVDVVSPVLDRTSRSADLVARIGNPDRELRPGMSAEVSVILEDRPGALTIPAEAVFFQGQQAFVYTVDDDDAVAMTPIELGTRSAALVEVLSGLEAGQTVVRAGHQKLFPGARVMPVGAPSGGAEAPDGAETPGGAETSGGTETPDTTEGRPGA
jgi:membrane fusion protein (multidrug efflux system)